MLNSEKGKTAKTVAVLAVAVFLLVGFFTIFSSPTLVRAQATELEQVGAQSGLGTTDIRIIIARIIRIVLSLLGIIALVITLYGGFMWMTSAGNAEKIDTAKKILINGVIGLVIILSAFAITQFILSRLAAATGTAPEVLGLGGEGPDLSSFNGHSALGTVISDHYPARGAVNIPRNTKIIITFKPKIKLASLIEDTNGDGKLGVPVEKNGALVYDKINTKTFELFAKPEAGAEKQLLTDVNVITTDDEKDPNFKRIFVFDPVPLLGSTVKNTAYAAHLTSALQLDSGASAFGGTASDYDWDFEVSTNSDNTPPQVTGVQPIPDATEPRNVIVQVSFNEPVDPFSAAGTIKKGDLKSFANAVLTENNNAVVVGVWKISNDYRTIEFTSNEKCGQNACGADIFCLPASNTFRLEVKAADLEVPNEPLGRFHTDGYFGYHGIVDVAGNSLDGGGIKGAGKNGVANGPPDDNFSMTFSTTAEVKISPPAILAVQPVPGASGGMVNAKDPITVQWSSPMSYSSFDGITLDATPAKAAVGFWRTAEEKEVSGGKGTLLSLNHSTFAPKSTYIPSLPSSVTDLYQNCFLPSAGPGCTGTPPAGQNTCCNGSWSSGCDLVK